VLAIQIALLVSQARDLDVSRTSCTLHQGHRRRGRSNSWILAGIHGFIDYADLKSQFRPALAAIRDGRLWMPVQTAEGFSPWLEDKERMGFASPGVLTPQEVTILSLLSRNLSNKEIGNRLRISERTVKFHLTNMFNKLGVRSRHALARFAMCLPRATEQTQQAVGF